MTPSKLSQKEFARRVGDDTVVSIRPSRVSFHTGTKWPVTKARLARLHRVFPRALTNIIRPALKNREPFVVPARHFGAPVPMFDTPRYLKIADFIQRKGRVEDTIWYRELAAELASDGAAHHKDIEMQSEAEIAAFFDGYVTPLVESLRRDGFDPGKTGFESAAVVDADGRLSKAGSGNHRFAICQVLDSPRFPLRVVAVHEDWYARAVLPQGDSWEALRAALARVEADHR